MNDSVVHHPEEEMLARFARRELPAGLSVIVSAHLEMCGLCRARVAEFESAELRAWNAEPQLPQADAPDFGGMIERIVKQPRHDAAPVEMPAADALEKFVKDLRLPRALRQSAVDLRWTRLTEGIHQAIAPIDHQTRCEFIYMAAGASTPVHTHYGREYTLVLQGRFHDELGSYGNGDFLSRDASHEHQPASETGCLSFAVLDRPLRFTRGLPRLLNPINRLRFRSGLAR